MYDFDLLDRSSLDSQAALGAEVRLLRRAGLRPRALLGAHGLLGWIAAPVVAAAATVR